MATLPIEVESSKGSGWVAAGLVAGILVALCGCAAKVYDAKRLPAELVAPPAQGVRDLNLARLGGFASSSELIDCGDLLEVTIVTDYDTKENLTTPVRVTAEGTANVPMIGTVELAGLELEEAERAISAAAIRNGIYRNPHITVSMKRQRTNRVTVVGAVLEPGVYELPRGSSYLLSAIVEAGGLSGDASTDVEIRRSARAQNPDKPRPPQVAGGGAHELTSYHEAVSESAPWVRVNLASAIQEGNGAHYLSDGDTVMIPRQEPRQIHVMGLVNKPGQYALPYDEDVYLLDALAMAGGRSMELADKVWILRRASPEQAPARIEVSVREAKLSEAANVRLAPGDLVSVEQTPTTFVWDLLRSFFRFSVGSSLSMF